MFQQRFQLQTLVGNSKESKPELQFVLRSLIPVSKPARVQTEEKKSNGRIYVLKQAKNRLDDVAQQVLFYILVTKRAIQY